VVSQAAVAAPRAKKVRDRASASASPSLFSIVSTKENDLEGMGGECFERHDADAKYI
jgi:hypothetical protein